MQCLLWVGCCILMAMQNLQRQEEVHPIHLKPMILTWCCIEHLASDLKSVMSSQCPDVEAPKDAALISYTMPIFCQSQLHKSRKAHGIKQVHT